jgi:hypothetical protein
MAPHDLLNALLHLSPLALAAAAVAAPAVPAAPIEEPKPKGTGPGLGPDAVERAVARLLARFGEGGEGQGERIRLGVRQVAERWWPEDGDGEEFVAFCEESFLADPAELAATFARLEERMEQIDGHIHEVRREVMTPLDLDTGPLAPVDRLLGDLDLGAHVEEDLFETKVAFLALLNFPVHTLAERLAQGASWDRETWARSRMMDRFALRVPADVLLEGSRAFTAADRYIADYNIRMDRLVTTGGPAGSAGERLFPEGLRLISHWGLRDDLASRYVEPEGLRRQRMTQTVMERILRQEIPRAAIDNPNVLWDPEGNQLWNAADGTPLPPEREPDTRYARLLEVFHAVRKTDPFSPAEPTFVARRFERDRQIPEAEVEALLVSVLDAPEVQDLGREIARRLGRPLLPFDLWYPGFKSRGRHGEAELDARVQARFPTVDAFAAALPETLQALGFTPEKARWLAERIAVDPARGAGHAVPALRREDKAHLRTRVPRGGMDYQGYNVALHELGHNVEQVFSLHGIDHWWLSSVPNNACTEAFAFLFQGRDLELLGLGEDAAEARRARALSTLWNTYEISGVSLVDMRVWNWLYAHPEATPAELREATLAIARAVWNRHFAPVFGVEDVLLLAIYSHMISNALYLPDYAIGHLICFQIAEHVRGGDFGAECERIACQGRLTPDAWVRGAVGGPVSADALRAAAREALAAG